MRFCIVSALPKGKKRPTFWWWSKSSIDSLCFLNSLSSLHSGLSLYIIMSSNWCFININITGVSVIYATHVFIVNNGAKLVIIVFIYFSFVYDLRHIIQKWSFNLWIDSWETELLPPINTKWTFLIKLPMILITKFALFRMECRKVSKNSVAFTVCKTNRRVPQSSLTRSNIPKTYTNSWFLN